KRSRRPSPYKLYIPVLLEEFEVPHEIELLRAHFEFRESNHLRQVSLPITPVQRRDGYAPEGGRRILLSLLSRQIVQCDGPHPFAADDNLLRFAVARRRDRLNPAEPHACGAVLNRPLQPVLLLFGEVRETRQALFKIP